MKAKPVNTHLHRGDLPAGLSFGGAVAIDTETMGLEPQRDRLCLVQLSGGDGECHLVQFASGDYKAPRLKALLADPKVLKIFHFARFDHRHAEALSGRGRQAGLLHQDGVETGAHLHRPARLKDLCRELLGVELSKQQQSSDWGAATLTEEQLRYAASDVEHLHALKAKLDEMLAREGRTALAQACFAFLPLRAALDLAGFPGPDLFEH